MASGAPHLCYWRLGRLDRHTPRTNDPATWRNIRHLESTTSRQAGYVGVQQEGYAMIHNMSRVKTCQNCHLASRPPCSTHSILIPTELLPVRSAQTYADEVQRRTHCWPSHHGKMAWGLRHRHHDGLFCWGGTWLATGVFLGKKTHVFLAFGSQVGILILGSCIV